MAYRSGSCRPEQGYQSQVSVDTQSICERPYGVAG